MKKEPFLGGYQLTSNERTDGTPTNRTQPWPKKEEKESTFDGGAQRGFYLSPFFLCPLMAHAPKELMGSGERKKRNYEFPLTLKFPLGDIYIYIVFCCGGGDRDYPIEYDTIPINENKK